MPIYAYKCESCGFSKDVLQKVSDPKLTRCPACGAETFQKQVTAAGFQLKGSGWYVTDFRGGDTAGKPTENNSGSDAKPASGESPAVAAEKGGSAPAEKSGAAAASTSSASTSAPSAAPVAAAPVAPTARKD